jgi:long-chain acyl-CoA synthetase
MSARTVFTLVEEAAAKYGKTAALHQPTSGEGAKYRVYSWDEWRDASKEVACGLHRLGIKKGDVAVLSSETRAEFYIADMGIMACGGTAGALYTSYPPEQLVATLHACHARLVFVDTPKALKSLLEAGGSNLETQWVLLTGQREGFRTLEDVRMIGRQTLEDNGSSYFDSFHRDVRSEDNAILYLTSGATGEPKMVLVSHGALVANVDMGPKVAQMGPDDVALAFLPSAHIAQRMGVELLCTRTGVPTYFSEGLSRLPHELQRIRPTFFLAPPRVWERIHASISTEIRKRGGATRRMFHGALGLGVRASQYRYRNQPLPGWLKSALKIADRLVFTKLRERFGGRMRMPVSGAAPLGSDLAQFYDAIGMPIIEGYGLTEGGVVNLNPPVRPKLGSIGPFLPGVLYKITDEGELLLSGPTLFSGYYKDPAGTAQVLRDGWLYTGDLAEVDADGYAYITGRKKEMIVSSNGKKVYPSRIENLFKTEPLVNQMILVGDKKPYVSALFTLNVAAAETLSGMEEYKGKAMAEVVSAPAVHAELKKAVARANKQLAPFEQIRKFKILDRDFSIEKGELTATMKVRRTQVLENFRNLVSEFYAGKDDAE